MQEAIPYKSYTATTANSRLSFCNFSDGSNGDGVLVISDTEKSVKKLAMENSVLVFSRRGCCMCHVMRRLLLGLGVNLAVCEVEEEKELGVMNEMSRINGDLRDERIDRLPVVFVGRKLFGGWRK
ncbi:hypothetical protein J1N35_033039 [Gossypium stocksii]|uniref:Glutaredoxin domain-containing protein n=1 Tax=Gossypium stocksii TaxID=47602 RepID=A0A9D3UQ70_9ROSI|nr:hypothetical protein J1N35_033039 [Gossypium stocksii]